MTAAESLPVTKVRWSDAAPDRPLPLIERRRLVGRQMMVSHVTLARGFRVDMHSHENEQISCVLSGRFRFEFGPWNGEPGRSIEVTAGETILLPSHVPHAGEALEDTVILDLFSPPSQGTGVDRR